MGRILVVDDEQAMCEMLEVDLRRRGHAVVWETEAAAALTRLQNPATDLDVVVTDLNMPGFGGIALCEGIVSSRPDLPVVVLTAFGSLETAIAAIRAGAYDFVNKPVDLDLLAFALDRASRHHALQRQIRRLEATIAVGAPDEDQLIGDSEAMDGLRRTLARIAPTDTTVLVTGESGTGKELAAQYLHRHSRRRERPFVAVNCAALPPSLLESELFGHRRGAFTDARSERRGLFLEAEGGTLFLDEIGEMDLLVQPKLLRALEERRVRPVGGDQETTCDVRVIAATNRDLVAAVAAGRFREDLYYRLDVIGVEVPPLRDRGADVLLLAQHFVLGFAERFAKAVQGISRPAAERLLAHSWPGNVRELRNAIEHAVALTQFDQIAVADLPERLRDANGAPLPGPPGPGGGGFVTLAELERRYLRQVLAAAGGNRSRAARILGLDRKTLFRKLQRLGE